MFSKLMKMFFSNNSKIYKYVQLNSNLEIEKEVNSIYIKLNKKITKNEISELLGKLWKYKFEFTFHDIIHPSISDPGVYFSYSTEKTIGKEYWSMTCGNHGWHGGVYHIKKETISQQIFNLISKRKIDKIRISGVSFLSRLDVESDVRSEKKDKEIYSYHT